MRTGIVSAAIAAIVAVILLLGAGDDNGPNAFVVIGIATGAVYGLLALGLVLVYKGSRVFNFAQGEFGTMAAFVLYVLIDQVRSVEIPYGVAAAAGVTTAVLIGLVMERVVVRPLLNAPKITLLVATIGFALLLIGIELLLFLPEVKNLAPLIEPVDTAGNPRGLELFNFFVAPQQLIVIALLIALAVVLGYFFSKTDLGLAVLATSQDAFATRIVGVGVERMSRFIWGTAAFLGGVAGILYVPISGVLTPGALTSPTTGVLIPAFTGAVIGGMTSLPGAFVGGLSIGIIGGLAQWASSAYSIGDQVLQNLLPGFANAVVFLALLVVLLVRPQGLLGREA